MDNLNPMLMEKIMKKRNHEHYMDTVPYNAITKIEKENEQKRLVRLKIALKATRAIFKEFGFEVIERIVVRDLESNKTYK